MADNVKPDLNKLRTEIDSRKREKGMIAEGTHGTTIQPKDIFLKTLMDSLATGQNTPAVNNIKTMNERADIVTGALKTGVVTPEAIKKINELKNSTNYVAPVQQYQQPPQPGRIPMNEMAGMSPERDDAMYGDINRKMKSITLAESIDNYNKGIVNPNQLFNAKGQPVHPDGSLMLPPAPTTVNEGYLVENVKKIATNYLIENLGPIMEESIKSTILEMYAVDRIKEVLNENKEMIKTIVYETIRELQAKSKSKAQ